MRLTQVSGLYNYEVLRAVAVSFQTFVSTASYCSGNLGHEIAAHAFSIFPLSVHRVVGFL